MGSLECTATGTALDMAFLYDSCAIRRLCCSSFLSCLMRSISSSSVLLVLDVDKLSPRRLVKNKNKNLREDGRRTAIKTYGFCPMDKTYHICIQYTYFTLQTGNTFHIIFCCCFPVYLTKKRVQSCQSVPEA